MARRAARRRPVGHNIRPREVAGAQDRGIPKFYLTVRCDGRSGKPVTVTGGGTGGPTLPGTSYRVDIELANVQP